MSMRAPPAILASCLLALSALSCQKRPPPETDAQVEARARAAIGPFKVSLKGALEKALAESVGSAIDTCSKRAPELAKEHSKGGVTVGRSALKLRNAKNAPPPWLGPVMDRLSKAKSGTDAHEVVTLEGGRRGYAEAIWIAPPCLTCHGESLAPEVTAALDARYPGDAARGFHPGEFRGVFWAELDAR